jgi:hypothetical protein
MYISIVACHFELAMYLVSVRRYIILVSICRALHNKGASARDKKIKEIVLGHLLYYLV